MSGPHRKVSRSLVDASAAISPGTGSHAHFRQPENELKQKLDAIDTSFRISNKKLSSETRELKQILFDLQQDLKGSKSLNHYVPSSFEEQHKPTERQRRITIASGNRDLSYRPGEPTMKAEASQGLYSKVTSGTPTKRHRKISGASPHSPKILVQEEDVMKCGSTEEMIRDDNSQRTLTTNAATFTVESRSLRDSKNDVNVPLQEAQQTISCKQQEDAKDVVFYTTSDANNLGSTKSATSFRTTELNKDLPERDDFLTSNRMGHLSHSGLFSYSSSRDTQADLIGSIKTGPSCSLAYSKHFNEDRKRSLSESDTNYRNAFKGRFVTPSLPEKLKDQCRINFPGKETQKRTRRVTVSGPPPCGSNRFLDIGDIPITPFHPGSRRKKSVSGKGPTGSLRRGIEMSEESDNVFESNDESRSQYNLTIGRSQEPRQRRYSSVYKTGSSSLPPLKEETRAAANHAAIAKHWENLESCRYLRKGDEALSIEDIFRKD